MELEEIRQIIIRARQAGETPDLRRLDLQKVDLSGADLSRVNLSYTNLSRAKLSGTNLEESNLTGVDFRKADLKGANLRKSNLLGADLAHGQEPQAVVSAGHWQQARSLGAWTLVGCTVAPGFTFSGFEMAPPGFEPPG